MSFEPAPAVFRFRVPVRGRNPATLPIFGREQTHPPTRLLAPVGWPRVDIIPGADLPPADLARLEGAARVTDKELLVGIHFPSGVRAIFELRA